MSEQAAEATATETEGSTEQAGNEQAEQQKPSETVDFWKQKAREQEKRAKANSDAAKRLAEIEESQKSEAQKATDRIAAAEQAANEARNEALRYKIATEFELSTEDAEALEHVTSEDGMRLVAGRLAAKADAQKKNGNHSPREGAPPAGSDSSDAQWVRSFFGDG